MNKIDIKKLKELKEQTDAAIMDCRKALIQVKGDMKKAKSLLEQWGFKKAQKLKGKKTTCGVVECYIHAGRQIGSIVKILCETDFVARNGEFINLCHEIAMQIVAMNPKNIDELLKQQYIKENTKTIKDLIDLAIAKFGENINIDSFNRLNINES